MKRIQHSSFRFSDQSRISSKPSLQEVNLKPIFLLPRHNPNKKDLKNVLIICQRENIPDLQENMVSCGTNLFMFILCLEALQRHCEKNLQSSRTQGCSFWALTVVTPPPLGAEAPPASCGSRQGQPVNRRSDGRRQSQSCCERT